MIPNGHSHHAVAPGTRLRIRGRGCVVNATTDMEIACVADGEAEAVVPERCFAIAVIPLPRETESDVEIDIIPPDREKTVVPIEPNRTYTLVNRSGDVTVSTPQGQVLARLGDDERGFCEFTTPEQTTALVIDKAGETLISETPLTREDFEPELSALNAKLARKGFRLGYKLLTRVDDGRGVLQFAVDDVALTLRENEVKPVVSREVIRHG